MTELRWQQRFVNFDKAFRQLCEAVEREAGNDKLIRAGLIQTFEFTFELAWKTLKDYLEFNGITATSPRDTIKQAYQAQYIPDGTAWLEMLEKRNLMTHTYDEARVQEAVDLIKEKYFKVIQETHGFFKSLKSE